MYNGNKLGYVRAHYDTAVFCTGSGKNITANIRNRVVEGINKEVVLPKVIILVFENDMLNSFKHFLPGLSLLSGRCLEWLANQLHRIVVAHKEKLPSKSRKFKYPTILWTMLPPHYDWSKSVRESREKFNTCIKNTVSLFREMEVLELEEWDDCDRSLVTKGKLNAKGLNTFWIQLDRAVMSWDKRQMSKIQPVKQQNTATSCSGKKKMNPNHFRQQEMDSSKYKWTANNVRFTLPKPKNF